MNDIVEKLQDYSMTELKKIAEIMQIHIRRSKKEMIDDICLCLKEYLSYKKDKIDRYIRKEKLGEGKEGTTYLVLDKKNKEYAMKTFRPGKSIDTLKREYYLQKKAGDMGVSPKVHNYDIVSKYIVMDKMDGHLYSLVAKKQKGKLKKEQQLRILEIFDKLDQAEVFHNDPNLANYMYKGDTIYIIDFGFSKEITSSLVKKLGTPRPNGVLMVIGLILKLREEGFDAYSYKYLKKRLNKEQLKKYDLED
jgi:tRNA A-37 threonylcarbamoyl transferase component Bud32